MKNGRFDLLVTIMVNFPRTLFIISEKVDFDFNLAVNLRIFLVIVQLVSYTTYAVFNLHQMTVHLGINRPVKGRILLFQGRLLSGP